MSSFTFDDDAAFEALSINAGHRGGVVAPPSTRSGISALSGESEFRTAQSTASTVTGGEGEASIGGTTKTPGLVPVMLVADQRLYCRAVIGSTNGNRRFCTKLCNLCAVRSHTDDDPSNPVIERVEIPAGTLLIAHRKGQALERPQAMRSWFSDEELNRALVMKQKVDVWKEWFDFRAREAQVKEENRQNRMVEDEDDEEEWEEVVPSPRVSIEDVNEGREDLMSPRSAGLSEVAAKLPKSLEINTDGVFLKPTKLESLLKFMVDNGDEGMSPELLASLREIVADWDKIQANFETLGAIAAEQAKSQGALKGLFEESLMLTDDKFRKLDIKAGILMSSIGSKPADGDDLSIWDAIHDIRLEMKGLAGSIDKLEQNLAVESERRRVDIDKLHEMRPLGTSDLVKEVEEFRDQYKNRMSTLHHILSGYSSRLSDLESSSHPGGGTYHGRSYDEVLDEVFRCVQDYEKVCSKEDLFRLQLQVESLQHQFQRAFGGQSSSTPSRPGAHTSAPGTSWDQLAASAGTRAVNVGAPTWTEDRRENFVRFGSPTETLTENPNDVSEQVKAMNAKLQKLLDKGGAQSCEFGRWNFNTERDAMTFLERTNMEIGWLIDLFTALVAMITGKQTGRGLADDYWSAARIGSTNLRNNLLAAMGSDRPACLFGDNGHGRAKPLTEGMARVKSHTDWAATAEPYRNTLERDLNGFILGVLGAMPSEEDIRDPNELEGVQLAKHLIEMVRSQWASFVSFIDSSYIELRFRANFTEKNAWLLVGRFAAAVFNEMIRYRSRAKMLNDPATLQSRTAVFWAVLQCHRVMKEFIDLQFTGHTAIVREMSYFMLSDRVSSEEVENVKRKLEESKNELAATNKKLKQTEERLDKVESKCADLKSDIAALSNSFKQFKSNDGKGKKPT